MINGWLDYVWYGNSLRAWVITACAVVVTMFVIALLRSFLCRRLGRAGETETDYDDFALEIVRKTRLLLLFFPVLHFSLRALALSHRVDAVTRAAAILAFLLQAGLWASAFAEFWLGRYKREKLETDAAAATTIAAASFMLRLVLWAIVLLLALDNLGFNVSALIAGLGVGGIAVALATQNILGDLFASLSIVIDKPFVIGDFIIVDDYLGSVEYVGLKTTRVRSLGGEQIIFSNSDLLKSRIRNFKRMLERRVLFRFGVVYQTPRELLEAIPGMVKEIIEGLEMTRFDRAHFQKFSDSSLDFEVVYYVLAADYPIYMDIQQAINLELVRRFAEKDISFAYPTRTLFVTNSESHVEEPSPANRRDHNTNGRSSG